jgi:phosphohistidine phosphatase
MKRLLLIRHAKSSWKHPEVADVERPLNKRGKKDAPMMGQRLARQQINLDCILSSPAKRAIKTATLIAKELGFPSKNIAINPQLYAADVADLLTVLQQIDDAYNRVMVCGHHPGITRLSAYLTNDPIEKIPTCGMVCIDCAIDSWTELAQGRGTVVFFDYPKNPTA